VSDTEELQKQKSDFTMPNPIVVFAIVAVALTFGIAKAILEWFSGLTRTEQ